MKKLVIPLAVAVVLAASPGLQAQDPEQMPPDVDDAPPAVPAEPAAELTQRVEVLQRELETLRAELSAVRRDHERDIQDLNRVVRANTDAIRSNSELIRSNADAIRSNAERIDADARVIADNSRKLNDIARLDERGDFTLDVLGNMQRSESFRRDFQQAAQGKLWIYNPGDAERVIYINGSRWLARTGWSYVWVPVGRTSVARFSGVTPPLRDDWFFSDTRQQFEMVYDFERPWD